MTKEQRLDFQYYSAAAMLFGGMALNVAGFIVPPVGEISNSVLWIFAQTLIYAGSVFGITTYIKSKEHDIENRVNDKLNELLKNK